jgi:ferrochelatase
LGRTPWIKPYTDLFYESLPKKGIKRLAVACPAFVADCLETLEEVELRGRDQFVFHGGEDLKLVPSLNSTESWSKAVSTLLCSGSILA